MCKLAAEAAHSSGELIFTQAPAGGFVAQSKLIVAAALPAVGLNRICVSPGAEQASSMLRAYVQVAQAQVDTARKLSEDANKKLAETKVEEIQRMAEYAAFRDNNEEPELHEAYLRED